MRRSTVLLADDHAIVTDGLARILTEAHFDVVGAVRDGQQLLDAATRLRPDVIITDLSMPGLSGLDALARLRVPTRSGIWSKSAWTARGYLRRSPRLWRRCNRARVDTRTSSRGRNSEVTRSEARRVRTHIDSYRAK